MSTSAALPSSPIPIITTVAEFRKWRADAFEQRKSVGFVPTMGALHDGHISLVKHSLAANDLTVLSIFVNPAQFAPHEDLSTYPRTLESDIKMVAALPNKIPNVIFAPTVNEMYPSGIDLNVSEQRGTFIEVKGYGHVLEGVTRPHFFRGVATVVTKLFNIVQPTNAYFGQKDIQQAYILRRMTRDLLMSYPSTANLHIIETTRDPKDGLALSSRNSKMSEKERRTAPCLYAGLKTAHEGWLNGKSIAECLNAAQKTLLDYHKDVGEDVADVLVKMDYISFNDSETLQPLLQDQSRANIASGTEIILSGACWVGSVRIIDNIVIAA